MSVGTTCLAIGALLLVLTSAIATSESPTYIGPAQAVDTAFSECISIGQRGHGVASSSPSQNGVCGTRTLRGLNWSLNRVSGISNYSTSTRRLPESDT